MCRAETIQLRVVQKFNGVTTTVNLNQEPSTIPSHNGGHHPLSMTKALPCMFHNYALDAPKQCSARSGAMLCKVKSNAFSLWELCFPTRRAMLLAYGSIAFGLWELCLCPRGTFLAGMRNRLSKKCQQRHLFPFYDFHFMEKSLSL